MSYRDYEKIENHDYCYSCGLHTVKGALYVVGYDSKDGTPVRRFKLYCPRWFQFWGNHFREEFGEDGIMIPNYGF